MEEKKLYPMRLLGTERGYMETLVGGGWLGGTTLDELMELYMDRVTGEDVFRWYGLLFPVQMRRIQTTEGLPLTVHPADEVAAPRFDALGKEKFWYVKKAGKGARLLLGLTENSDAGTLWTALKAGDLSPLNAVIPRPGESYAIPAGTLHGAEGELELIEVSQSSELDFPLPELLEEALDFIDYKAYTPAAPKGNDLLQLPQFSVSRVPLPKPLQVRAAMSDAYSLFYALKGGFRAETEDGDCTQVPEDGILLIPAEVGDYQLIPENSESILLAVTTERREESDDITYHGDPDSDDDKIPRGKGNRVS